MRCASIPRRSAIGITVPFRQTSALGVIIEIDAASSLPPERLKPITAVRDVRRAFAPDWIELMRFPFRLLPAADGRDRDSIVAAPLALGEAAPQKSLLPSPQATSARFVPNHVPTPAAAAGHRYASPRRSRSSTHSCCTASPAQASPRLS